MAVRRITNQEAVGFEIDSEYAVEYTVDEYEYVAVQFSLTESPLNPGAFSGTCAVSGSIDGETWEPVWQDAASAEDTLLYTAPDFAYPRLKASYVATTGAPVVQINLSGKSYAT